MSVDARNWMVAGVMFFTIVSGTYLVFAVQGANILVGQSSGMNYSYSENGTLIQIQPGNLTFLEIYGTASGLSGGFHWTGFYGNISGNLTLEDANGNVFYDWEGLGELINGEVFASNNSVVLWSDINCTNTSQILAINGFLNVSGGTVDSVEKTYTENAHPGFSVAGKNITANSCNSTNTYSNGTKSGALFNQVILSDSNYAAVFGTLINDSAASFDGSIVDFQLLSGVKSVGLTELFFFIEIG